MEVTLKAYNVKEHLGKHFISDEVLSLIRLNSIRSRCDIDSSNPRIEGIAVD